MIYAIDFDGTLVKNQYPYIGEEQKISTHMLDKTKVEKFIPATDFARNCNVRDINLFCGLAERVSFYKRHYVGVFIEG